MTLTKSNKFVLALAAVWLVGFSVHTGCDSSPNLESATLLTDQNDAARDKIITAQLAKDPIKVSRGTMSRRTNFIDLTKQIPSNATSARFAVRSSGLKTEFGNVHGETLVFLDLMITGSQGRVLRQVVDVASADLRISPRGEMRMIDNPITSDPKFVAELLKSGEIGLDVRIQSDRDGSVTIDQVEIIIGFGTGPVFGNGNDNTGNTNGNDNTGDMNGNDNTGDSNGNDNTDDPNGNDNTGDMNGNDNTDDSNGNDNTDDPNGNDNTGDMNGNDNTDDSNGNDNTDDPNGNDNTGDMNGNDNTDDSNGNDNTGNTNGNDNTADGVCSDGSIQLRQEIDGPGDFSVKVRYRAIGEDCRRFRLEIEGFATGWYDVFANDVLVGEIFADSDDGEGEVRWETDDGNFPSVFPDLFEGDVVSIGSVIDVVLPSDCSEPFLCDNSNGNDNTGNTNGNDNTGNTNGNDNTPDNTNANG